MVWDTEAYIIVMATGLQEGGRRKCERYWPASPEAPGQYGPFTVTMDTAVDCGDYIRTELTVCREGSDRRHSVLHFWYTGWPDHGAPDSAGSVLEMLHK